MVVQQVAETGLLKRDEPETVKAWIDRYLTQGIVGWQIKLGRGRKPHFSPSEASNPAVGVDRTAASRPATSRISPQSLVVGRHSTGGGSLT
jgi:hypothetical protein